MKFYHRNIAICLILLSGLCIAAIFQRCNPFKDDSLTTYSNFMLDNKSGEDLWINNKRFHTYIGDSGMFVRNGMKILLCGDAEQSPVHPFPGAVIKKIEAYTDSAGVPKLIYRQEPIINEIWFCEKVDNFKSIYTLTINEEDLRR